MTLPGTPTDYERHPFEWAGEPPPIVRMDPHRLQVLRQRAETWKSEMETTEMVFTVPESFIPKLDVELEEPTSPVDIKPWLNNGLPIPPVRYDAIATSGKGWKLHLNFDYKDRQTVSGVKGFLESLRQSGKINGFKIGNGGGAEMDAPGKEATVYVGHRDKTSEIAKVIDIELVDTLLPAVGDVLENDTSFHGNVWGRFEVNSLDGDFSNYGEDGYSILQVDGEQLRYGGMLYAGLKGDAAKRVFYVAARQRAKELLTYRYGEFFTGDIAEKVK